MTLSMEHLPTHESRYRILNILGVLRTCIDAADMRVRWAKHRAFAAVKGNSKRKRFISCVSCSVALMFESKQHDWPH